MSEENSAVMPFKTMLIRFIILLGSSIGIGYLLDATVLKPHQAIAVAVFLAIIMGTLFFWTFRLAVAFLGLAVLICTKSLTVPQFVQSSSLEVILFLVGMMVIVGALRDLGFFSWIIQLIVSMPRLTGCKFIAVTAAASALLACAVDEVTSIIFVSALIFQVCDRLKLDPTPYIIIAVLATNIGSSGTMMGNPVGIYIGNKAGLSFGDFMTWAFPLMLLALAGTIGLLLFYYRRELKEFDIRLQDRLSRNLSLAPKADIPYARGLVLIICTIAAIASHHQVEQLLGLASGSVLIVAPLICSGIVMILRPHRARHYVEREVDWWTLIFFMLLFAVAGTIEHTGVAELVAQGFTGICGTERGVLVPFILGVSAVGSAFVDNVIFVAAFSPVIEKLSITINSTPLWWALLFGACFGGNITMIGSTANIVALGNLEKKSPVPMTFLRWLKVGVIASLFSLAIVWGGLALLSPFMADTPSRITGRDMTRVFNDKMVAFEAVGSRDGSGNPVLLVNAGESAGDIVVAVDLPADGKIDFPYGQKRICTGSLTGTGGQGFRLVLKNTAVVETAE